MSLNLVAFPQIADATGSRTASGKGQLGQRVQMELLTPVGSIPYRSNRGSSFLQLLQQGARTETDVLIAFSAAKPGMEKGLLDDELSTDASSERYADSTVTKVIIDGGTLTLELKITSRATSTVSVTTPPITITL